MGVLKMTFQKTKRREEIAEWLKSQVKYSQERPDYNIGNIDFNPGASEGSMRKAPGWYAHEYCRENNFCGDEDPCGDALQNGQCRDDPHCPGAWKECGTQCMACYWVIRTYPVFTRA